MTSQHNTGTHPFYIGMYIHIYTHIYVHIYTSQKECLCIFSRTSILRIWKYNEMNSIYDGITSHDSTSLNSTIAWLPSQGMFGQLILLSKALPGDIFARIHEPTTSSTQEFLRNDDRFKWHQQQIWAKGTPICGEFPQNTCMLRNQNMQRFFCYM